MATERVPNAVRVVVASGADTFKLQEFINLQFSDNLRFSATFSLISFAIKWEVHIGDYVKMVSLLRTLNCGLRVKK